MSWRFAQALAFGGVLLAGLPVHADGDAEAPPSPGQVRHLPVAAQTAEPTAQANSPRLPASKTAAVASPAGTTPTVKTMLPADYRPQSEPVKGTAEPPSRQAGKAATPSGGKPTVARKKGLPLAPSAAEYKREIELRNGGPDNPPVDNRSTGEKLADKATSIPNQRRTWPTTVTNTAGPTSPAGPGSAQDRKGTVIEASGPQQGVIRNRW